MRAQRLVAPARFEQVEVPDLSGDDLVDGQVLLRMLAGGICGSDFPKFRGHKGSGASTNGAFLPGPIGFPMHEVVGETVASRHPSVRVGSLVVGWAVNSDALAEYVITSGDQVNEFDQRFTPTAAVLLQSLACVLYPLQRLDVRRARVVILGLGPIGLLFARVLKRAGAAHITGIDPIDRGAVAARFGLDQALRTTSGAWAAAVEDPHRPDLVIEAVGHQVSTLQHAIVGCAVGGRILYFGIPDDAVYPLDMERLMRKDLTLIGGVTRQRRQMLSVANDHLLADPSLAGDIAPAVYPFDRVQDAFDVAGMPAADRLKVVVTAPDRT